MSPGLTGQTRHANIFNIMNANILDRKRLELTDGIITLRPYHKDDYKESYQAIKESAAEMSAWLPFVHDKYSLKESRAWVKKQPDEWKNGAAYNFAIIEAVSGRIIGGCGLNAISKLDKRANLGYWVRTSDTGRGVAAAATLLLAKWGFAALQLLRIEIGVAVENTRSLRVAEKVGATREGVLRNRIVIREKPHDAVMHSLIPADFNK